VAAAALRVFVNTASAGYNGQQITLNYFESTRWGHTEFLLVAPRMDPPTNVVITGANQCASPPPSQ
jgi:hypothetical protein